MPTIKKKYTKTSGELIHPIVIERKMSNPPKNGIVEVVWETIYSPRASVSNNTGKEYLKQGVELYGVDSKKFTFRSHPVIEVKQNDVINYKNERWEIVSVYDYDDVNIFTVVVAKKVNK